MILAIVVVILAIVVGFFLGVYFMGSRLFR